ncbi:MULTISPECIES: hypothetical protein [Bacillaceae]|uniref:Phr family secreted Rap phosphatase inhibitor n=1 Tax=Bacillus salipaludis TaxID=2547811 RepID=A0AA90R545_9BACI|nr:MULTISPECIES: hypothetical protein [Bacillaceae]MBI0578763.1 hypothetical protein [Neobacillus cucumis]MDQ6595878.1 hypothetical protein [Bacillus salipaludis]MED1471254.1 hypothetical protein [Bacillus salipaludis]WHY92557.1 hypothetical protein QNK12_03345 [Neobacillus cucumis]
MLKKLILVTVIIGAFLAGALKVSSSHDTAHDILPKVIYSQGNETL